MKRVFTCVVCPNGCEIEADYEGTDVRAVTGNLCPKGRDYVVQELVDPRRTIATSVRVTGGDQPLASVRLTGAIPKARIFDAMRAINARTLAAPAAIGDVVIHDLMGLGCDVIVTRNVPKV